MDRNIKKIYIEPSEDSPLIHLDKNNLIFDISGPSYAADTYSVYQKVLDWLDEVNEFNGKLKCKFDFSLLSSASHKMVFEILLKLENLYNSGNDITVDWYYAQFDEDMLEVGEAFSETINLPFDFFPKDTKSFFRQ